jgi:hypothetical protein
MRPTRLAVVLCPPPRWEGDAWERQCLTSSRRIVARGQPPWGLPKVIVSPHMAADCFGWREALREVFTENLRRVADARPLRNVVDIRLRYVGSVPLVGTSRKGSIG